MRGVEVTSMPGWDGFTEKMDRAIDRRYSGLPADFVTTQTDERQYFQVLRLTSEMRGIEK